MNLHFITEVINIYFVMDKRSGVIKLIQMNRTIITTRFILNVVIVTHNLT